MHFLHRLVEKIKLKIRKVRFIKGNELKLTRVQFFYLFL